MHKIKLIKPFANYEVWEYELQSDWWYSFSNWVFRLTHCLHKDIVERFKDHFEEVKDRSTSWEELWEIGWYWVDSNCEIYSNWPYAISTKDEGKNVFKNKQQAEASIALAQITQLLAAYDIPEESNIRFHHDWYDYNRKWLLWFDTKEKRDHFYKHHKALIDKLAPFYIF